jgi:hypothetical protein
MNSNQYHHFHHHNRHSINEKQNLYNLLKKSNINIIEESLLKKIIDSSHLITFCISISVIIYASFRSLNIDSQPAAESNENKLNLSNRELEDENDDEQQTVQTIDSCQALAIPVAASVSLLLMFFFFDSIQTAFLICTSSKIIIINKMFI